MANTVAPARGAAPANDVAPGCTGTAAPATEGNRVFVACVNRVIDTSGEKAQAVAQDAQYSEFQFSRIRSCQSGSLDFVDRLPRVFQRAIAREFALAHGFLVSEPTPQELTARVYEAFDALSKAMQLAKVSSPDPVKARWR